MPFSSPLAVARSAVNASPLSWWRRWWRRQTPVLQDAVAMLAPMAAVLLFLAAIVTAFWYLRTEEVEREQESVRRDVEYAQQRMRLRLLERQEQLMRIARDASNREIDPIEFTSRAESLVSQFPELQTITWIDDRRRFKAGYAAPSVHPAQQHLIGDVLRPGDIESNYALARELRQPVFSQPAAGGDPPAMLQLHIPLFDQGLFAGVVLGEFSVDGLLRYGMPSEVQARYAVSLLDAKGKVIAGNTANLRETGARLLPWSERTNEYEVPVSPVGNALVLRAQAYRTSQGVVGNGLFWLVCALSVLTSWMLIGTWRHTRRRLQAQQRLVAETNFRRAMENSMLTGMRVLDLQGRITYVNPAFCKMVGFAAEELVGKIPPMPYWAPEAMDEYQERFSNVLAGRATPQFETIFQRRDGERFPVLIFESPLVDQDGKQTGWMGSILDISERKRAEDLNRTQEEKLQASARLASMGEIASTLAHELNQPLAAISSYTTGALNMMQQGQADPKALQPALEKIHTQAQRAGHVIRSVHQFVKKREPARQRLQIRQLVDNVAPLIELQAQQFFVVLQWQVPKSLPPVLGDQVLLEQVILNLTRNGIQAMAAVPSARRILRVTAELTRNDDGAESVTVSVIDQGHGIAEEVAARLFSPFFSTKAEGMGMGLNICRTTIEFHGGTLTYTDNPAGGTIFRFSLPAQSGQPQ